MSLIAHAVLLFKENYLAELEETVSYTLTFYRYYVKLHNFAWCEWDLNP